MENKSSDLISDEIEMEDFSGSSAKYVFLTLLSQTDRCLLWCISKRDRIAIDVDIVSSERIKQ